MRSLFWVLLTGGTPLAPGLEVLVSRISSNFWGISSNRIPSLSSKGRHFFSSFEKMIIKDHPFRINGSYGFTFKKLYWLGSSSCPAPRETRRYSNAGFQRSQHFFTYTLFQGARILTCSQNTVSHSNQWFPTGAYGRRIL